MHSMMIASSNAPQSIPNTWKGKATRVPNNVGGRAGVGCGGCAGSAIGWRRLRGHEALEVFKQTRRQACTQVRCACMGIPPRLTLCRALSHLPREALQVSGQALVGIGCRQWHADLEERAAVDESECLSFGEGHYVRRLDHRD